MSDKPEQGKVYRLTGDGTVPSISNGNSWAESDITEEQQREDERYWLTHCAHTIPGTCDFCPAD